jgi:hypothetical protein
MDPRIQPDGLRQLRQPAERFEVASGELAAGEQLVVAGKFVSRGAEHSPAPLR